MPDLPLLDYNERVEWAPGEQKEFATRHGRNPKNGDWALKTIETRVKGSGTVNFFFINQLSPEKALELLEGYPPSCWYNPDPREILELVARVLA